MIDDLQAPSRGPPRVKDQQATVTKQDVEIAALRKEMAEWRTKVAQMDGSLCSGSWRGKRTRVLRLRYGETRRLP